MAKRKKKKIKITAAAIRRAADGKSYKRGEDYFRRGMVYSLLIDGEAVVAKVRGTRNYRARLWAEDGEVEGECTCPMGDAGVFCKHLVAAGLTHLAGGAPEMPGDGEAKPPRRRKRPPKPKVTLDDVREHLLQQDPAELVEIIMEQVEEDDRLRESLLMQVARRRIDAATETGGFVDYREAYGFTSGIENVVGSIAELLDAGHAAEVIGLTEHALRRCERALGHMDDSEGGMSPILEQLQELHHAACLKTKPDPEALARRLFKWEIESGWDTFFAAAETYADVLGEKGLAVYRKLARKLWDQMPKLGTGDRRSFEGPRFRITAIMEALARASGDVEQLVAVKSRDLSSAYRYLDIAEGHIENLPVEDASVDVVISNCVINLSPDKPQVFREVYRVLKPGGRMIVSDIVLNRTLPESARNDADLYAACIAGALLRDEYLQAIHDAGSRNVKTLSDHTYTVANLCDDPIAKEAAAEPGNQAALLDGVAVSLSVWAIR